MLKANFELKTFTMPDGAPHCVIGDIPEGITPTITTSITSFNAFGELLVVLDAITRKFKGARKVELYLKYLPGRQDRFQDGFPFTLSIYAGILHRYNILQELTILHPHSEKTEKLTYCRSVYPVRFFREAVKNCNPDIIIAPDKGAAVWIDKWMVGLDLPVVLCEKTRDSSTGLLSNPIVHGDVSGKKCLIVDDICDGGGTFIMLGNELIKNGANKKGMNLFVTHGIFSKGYKELNKVFTNIYSTNSFHDRPDYCLEVSDESYKTIFYNVDNFGQLL